MRTLIAGLVCVGTLVSFGVNAEAKGCIKGAVVGGIAGHMAGHGKVGAAAGCAVGHHNANKSDKNAAADHDKK